MFFRRSSNPVIVMNFLELLQLIAAFGVSK
jgi:hypothetical protein